MIEVLQDAWLTVQIYLACTWQQHLPMGVRQIFFVDIPAAEIRAACALHRAPPKEWPLITTRIKNHMVPVARTELNRARK